ncbi:MAG: DUF305 domain-containing protein [Actinoplanes sp.]
MGRPKASMVVAALVVAATAAGVGIATQSGEKSAARPAASSAPPLRVVLPGAPGDPATVTDSDQVRAPDGSTYNAIDTTFVQMMIVHHGQAIEMARLAPGRAANSRLRALADRIGAAQAPEVAWLQSWLQARALPSSDPGHDHGTMPGMQTPAAMTELAGLSGAAFDSRFVTMMTAHHQGAVQMAGDVVGGGSDEQLREVANEMSVEQGVEIGRLAQLGVR